MLKTFEPLVGHSEMQTLNSALQTIELLYRFAARTISSISTHHISHRARPRHSLTTRQADSPNETNMNSPRNLRNLSIEAPRSCCRTQRLLSQPASTESSKREA